MDGLRKARHLRGPRVGPETRLGQVGTWEPSGSGPCPGPDPRPPAKPGLRAGFLQGRSFSVSMSRGPQSGSDYHSPLTFTVPVQTGA